MTEANVRERRSSIDARTYPGASLSTAQIARLSRSLIADVFDVSPHMLGSSQRGERALAIGRKLAVHLVHIVAGRKQKDVGRAFERNRSTANHHFESVEDLRDVPEFDAFVGLLEARFAVMLEYAEIASPRLAWRRALVGLQAALDHGTLEGEAVAAAVFVVGTFQEKGKK